MTVDDSIKCRCANSGMTGQVGGFQNPGVCLQAFPSFLPHPLPAVLLAPLFSRSLTLAPRSFLLNRTETLATQATGKPVVAPRNVGRFLKLHRLVVNENLLLTRIWSRILYNLSKTPLIAPILDYLAGKAKTVTKEALHPQE